MPVAPSIGKPKIVGVGTAKPSKPPVTAVHFWNTVPTMLPNARVAIARYSPLMRKVGRPIAAPHSAVNRPATGRVTRNGTPLSSRTALT